MARKRHDSETLDDLLRPAIERHELGVWCEEAGLRPWTVLRLRTGQTTNPHRGTVALLAAALGVSARRVRLAIERSALAAQEA